MIIFAIVGLFLFVVAYLFNKEANDGAEKKDEKITNTLENMEKLLQQLVDKVGEKNERDWSRRATPPPVPIVAMSKMYF